MRENTTENRGKHIEYIHRITREQDTDGKTADRGSKTEHSTHEMETIKVKQELTHTKTRCQN